MSNQSQTHKEIEIQHILDIVRDRDAMYVPQAATVEKKHEQETYRLVKEYIQSFPSGEFAEEDMINFGEICSKEIRERRHKPIAHWKTLKQLVTEYRKQKEMKNNGND